MLKFSEILNFLRKIEFSTENSYFERIRTVRMVRMVRALADRTFQLWVRPQRNRELRRVPLPLLRLELDHEAVVDPIDGLQALEDRLPDDELVEVELVLEQDLASDFKSGALPLPFAGHSKFLSTCSQDPYSAEIPGNPR